MGKSMLEIKEMHTSFKTVKGWVEAIRGVDLHIEEGEILGIVGESGSGKSVTMKSVTGLLAYSVLIRQSSEGIANAERGCR